MFCPQCRYSSVFNIQEYCTSCGTKLQQKERVEAASWNSSSIGIQDTKGDVIGISVSGTGNIIGKEIKYTVDGDVLNLNLNNVTNDVLERLQRIVTVQISPLTESMISYKEDHVIKAKMVEANNTQQEISSILEDLDKIEKKEEVQIQVIENRINHSL